MEIPMFIKVKSHYFFLLISIIFLMDCAEDSKIVKHDPKDEVESKSWTYIFYNDADYANIYDPLDDFNDLITKGKNINYIVLRDTDPGTAIIYNLESKIPTPQKNLGEVNVGDPQTLINLINYTKENFPAERYILAFYDHGGAWQGCCWDKSHDYDPITMEEIRYALSETGGIDLVLFTAPCLMGSLEAAYELRNVTDIYIGSEETSGFAWWFDAITAFTADMNTNPTLSNDDLAKNIINYIYDNRYAFSDRSWFEDRVTMAAVKTENLSYIINPIDSLSNYYLENFEAFTAIVTSDSFNVTSFGYLEDYYDLWDLMNKIITLETNEIPIQLCKNIKKQLDQAIIAKCHGNLYPDVHSLSIYFPKTNYNSIYSQNSYGLDFSSHTKWDELIKKLNSNMAKIQQFELSRGNGFYNW